MSQQFSFSYVLSLVSVRGFGCVFWLLLICLVLIIDPLLHIDRENITRFLSHPAYYLLVLVSDSVTVLIILSLNQIHESKVQASICADNDILINFTTG